MNQPCLAERRPANDAWTRIAALLRVLVGSFFLLAAGAKFLASDGTGAAYGLTTFAAAIAQHRVLPPALAPGAALLALLIEGALGAWLLLHARERLAAVATLATLIAFSVYLSLAHARVGNAPCGCLGKLSASTLAGALVRNAGLAALLIPTLLAPRAKPPRLTRSGT